MKLEIGNFYVKDVVFGDKTFYQSGVLTINKAEAIAFIKDDSHITDVDIMVAKPGDNTRIVPIKEAVEPRCKIDDRPLFPGVTASELVTCEDGVTHALKNCSVMAVGKHWGSFGDGIVDMSGPGGDLTYYSQLINICIVADTDELHEQREQQKKNHALRYAAHKFAEYLGQTVKSLAPEDKEVYELAPVTKRTAAVNQLPSVVYVMQIQTQMEELGYNSKLYGWDANHTLPTWMHPNEVLNGAVIGGSFMPCSSKWSTYDMQNCPTIKALYEQHGKTLNFLGVIMSNLNVALEQKERAALYVAQMARSMGADSAILAEEGYGNPDADFIACFVALEDAGVKTIGMTNECTGRDGCSQPLVALDPKANAIVSCGNVSQLLELPAMDLVIGQLASIGRDGLSGGWESDEKLGPSVRADGSIIIENNNMFCGDQVIGWSRKTMSEF